jgi:hypothetical protein
MLIMEYILESVVVLRRASLRPGTKVVIMRAARELLFSQMRNLTLVRTCWRQTDICGTADFGPLGDITARARLLLGLCARETRQKK